MISVTLLNLFALSFLSAGLYVWKKTHPQKKLNFFYVLMIFSCIPLLSVWRQGSYQSGDFQDHIYFTISFYDSLMDGIWFPRWSGAFCGGYGYPHIQFFYHLPYYISSFFHLMGFSFVASQKLLICFSFLGGMAAMYQWLKSEWGDKAAFIGSILCLLAPYTLAGAHFRNTLGEGVGLAILPIILWCIKKTFDKNIDSTKWYWWGVSALYVLLILAHHVVPILSLPFVISYFFLKMWQSKRFDLRKVLYLFLSLAFSFWLTAYHWVPILLEAHLIGQDHLRIIQFPAVYTYFFSPYRFGLLNQGPHGELTWTVGYMQWLILILGVFCLRLRKISESDQKSLKFLYIWFAILFFMLMPFTNNLWLALPLLNNFQFSHRLFFLIAIVIAMIGAILIRNAKIIYEELTLNVRKRFSYKLPRWQENHILILLIGITVALSLSTILNWGQRSMIPDLDDQKLTWQIPSWCDKEAVPNGLNVKEFKALPKRISNIDVIEGTAVTKTKKFEMEDHEYEVFATTPAKIRENTTYFAGWTVYLNEKEIPIKTDDPTFKGIIEFSVPEGSHQIQVKYEMTPIQKTFEKITLIGLILSGIVTASFIYKSFYE